MNDFLALFQGTQTSFYTSRLPYNEKLFIVDRSSITTSLQAKRGEPSSPQGTVAAVGIAVMVGITVYMYAIAAHTAVTEITAYVQAMVYTEAGVNGNPFDPKTAVSGAMMD